ncbi:hypothetical protein MRA01_28630 [Methylobacterium radiotolerans]|nr:hypothetical protein MRA01_28630 [Methylobacterium radiotolerans]
MHALCQIRETRCDPSDRSLRGGDVEREESDLHLLGELDADLARFEGRGGMDRLSDIPHSLREEAIDGLRDVLPGPQP